MRAIYTAIYGNYDDLKTQPNFPNTKYICFTDKPLISDQWEIRYKPSTLFPRLAAKWFKINNHLALPEFEKTVWIDGNMTLVSNPPDLDFGVAKHGERDCIYDEAQFCIDLEKYRGLPLLEQVSHYREQGYPAHNGLYSCGYLIRKHYPEAMEAWMKENERWTIQDQLSFPVILQRFNIHPTILPPIPNQDLLIVGHNYND